MATITLSNCHDNASNDPITNVSNANGAADGAYATATPTEDGVNLIGACNLSVVSTLTGLSMAITGYCTQGTGDIRLLDVSFLDASEQQIQMVTINAAFRTSAGDTAVDISSVSLANIQTTRNIGIRFLDLGNGGGTLRIDSLTATYTAGANTGGFTMNVMRAVSPSLMAINDAEEERMRRWGR